MEARNVNAIAITGDQSTNTTWEKVAEGKFNVIFAAPEAIFEKAGYFWNHILRKRSGALYSKFVAIGIDECHCLENWGGSGFRVDYQNLGTLREAFPSIPFVGLTATMTPMGTSYFFKSARFKKPAIIKQTVRRRNVNIWVVPISPITQNEYEGLHILFPDNISSPEDIPQTIIFYNGRVGCGRMAKWLRSQLPAAHGSESETIVRSYSGVLDEMSKRETLELLR
ncbi:MAG TPA: DEAD/DEAH box helicase, partial [Nitrososphaera sp.]|nr:DEAD/DEAH box helicase [Nitrososphaera sp.]